MPTTKVFEWKDPRPLTFAVTAAMVVSILQSLMQIVIALASTRYGHPLIAIAGTPLIWSAILIANWIVLLAVLAGDVIGVFWILRVSKNAHVLKGRNLDNSPMFAALWWYLIPFMSLFKPLVSLSEIWDVSAIDRQLQNKYKFVLYAWWISFFVNFIILFAGRTAHILMLSVMGHTINLFRDLGFIFITNRLCDMQLEKRMAVTFSDEPNRPMSVLERLNG